MWKIAIAVSIIFKRVDSFFCNNALKCQLNTMIKQVLFAFSFQKKVLFAF